MFRVLQYFFRAKSYWAGMRNLGLFILVISSKSTFSQTAPKFIPPTPTTAALFKFMDYPIDFSTGLTSINIPLYEIKSGQLTVPISMSYHASGRKVYAENGPIGLGWTLNAGGMISRVIYGSADEDTLSPFQFKSDNNINPSSTSDFDYLAGADKNSKADPSLYKDSEYDIFSYILNSNSGKFILKDNNGIKTAALIPFKKYKIQWTKTSDKRKISTFQIIDDNGITYNFIAGESSPYGTNYGYTSWLLDNIVSANKADIISFKYSPIVRQRVTYSQEYTLTDYWMNGYDGSCETEPNPPFNTVDTKNTENYSIFKLTEIDFKEGKVLFNIDNSTSIPQSEQYMVKNIQIFNPNNEVIKTIQFTRSVQDYVYDNWNTYKIDLLEFKDKVGTTVEKYGFEYFPTIYTTSHPNSINVKYRDYWGYYNASDRYNMVPRWDNIQYMNTNAVNSSNISVGHTDAKREPSLEPMKSGVLKKITYPTGGSAEFFYETNKYQDQSTAQTKDGAGLRIYQVKTVDPVGKTTYKTYKYGTSEVGYGNCNITPTMNYMSNEVSVLYQGNGGSLSPACGLTYRRRSFFSDFIPDLTFLAEQPIVYPEVTEYVGTEADNIGKTVYKYQLLTTTTPTVLRTSQGIPKYHVGKYNYWNSNALREKTEFMRVVNNGVISYVPKKKIESFYQEIESELVYALRIRRNYLCPQTGELYPVAPYVWPAAGGYSDRYMATYKAPSYMVYAYGNYTISLGYKNLSNTIETDYADNSFIVNETNYSYNSNNLLTKTDKTVSNNDIATQIVNYPSDFISDPAIGSISTKMVNANMLASPIEQIDQKNSIVIKGVKTIYSDWSNTSTPQIAPKTVQVKVGSNGYENRIQYYGYDANSNVLGVSKQNDVVTSYLWGYNKAYPIAEVKNAKLNEIYFAGFEEPDGWGGSTWSNGSYGQPISYYDNTFSHTGRSSAKMINTGTSEIVSHSPWLTVSLTSPTKFKYSGWVFSNGPIARIYLFMKTATESGYFTFVDNITTSVVNTWTYVEKEYTVPANITQLGLRIDNNSSGTVWFDDIRLHPSEAQMTTYTYDPLIGMTSQSDINNRPTSYEYDAFGRLKIIRDKDGKILKTFDYQYQQNP